MAETEHSQENIAYIRTHVDNIERMQRFAIASNPNAAAFVEQHMAEKKGSSQIYLALSAGPKNPEQLRSLTKQSAANVSKICTHLQEQGLIRKVPDPTNSRSFLYDWTELETMLRVSRIAKRLAGK